MQTRSGGLSAVNVGGFSQRFQSSPPTLEVEFAQLSDPGRLRKRNEDYVSCVVPSTADEAKTHGWLFALADGVGGHNDGEVASRLAVETVCDGFRRADSYELHRALVPGLFRTANTTLLDAGSSSKKLGPAMATTLVTCALRSDRVVVCHVGDSRCYLVRRGHAELLTRDHTIANDQIRLGLLSKKEAQQSEMRHHLSRSLGSDLFVGVDLAERQLFPGDVLVLCSDGLHGAITQTELELVISDNRDLKIAVQELVSTANQKDGSDNVTVQLIRLRNVERMGMYRGRPYQL